MSVRTWPGYAIAAFRWHKANQSAVFKSMFGSQSLEASTPLWEVSMSGVSEARAAARLIEAYFDSLNGFTDQVEIWNVEHPAPTGTMRGTMTLSGAEAQGSTSLDIVTSYGTNLLTAPEAFDNAAWFRGNCTITPNAIAAPDGTTTADAIVRTAAGNHYLGQNLTAQVAANNTFTASIYLRSGTYTGAVRVWLKDGAGVSLAINNAQPTAAWQRFTVSGTYPSGATSYPALYIDPSDDVGIAGDIFYAWGAKVESGTTATDYGFGKTLLTGDLLGLGSGLTQQVVPVSADAISTGQGNITVSVGIPLRNAFSLGAAVTWDKPKALFRQKTPFEGMQYKPDGADVWSLSLREDWRL